ncbi:hypothetical protein ACFWP7_14345 [Streptomyces sp. NPDC058470]|uniref:hypothetical protein n=1 Tax=Streptomyces sp. NPDC058470 TaxID=3346515 RepID=UPI00366A23F2
MSANPSPKGAALLLITLGILAALASSTAVFATHEHLWTYGIAAGCFMQFLGWTLHGRQLRGGA